MTTKTRTQSDQESLAMSMAEHHGQPGVHFYQDGRTRFVLADQLTKTRVPQTMIKLICKELLVCDFRHTAYALTRSEGGDFQLERIDF